MPIDSFSPQHSQNITCAWWIRGFPPPFDGRSTLKPAMRILTNVQDAKQDL